MTSKPTAPDPHEAGAEAEAVFVFGVHRSGTTLMRRILDTSTQLAVSGENHYLGHILARQGVHHAISKLGDLRDDAVVDRVVAHIYGRVARGRRWLRVPSRHWIWLIRNVPRAEFRQRLLDSDRSERAVFEAVLRAYADRRGKAIIGEKTPAHVRYADTLLRWFPRGRLIHMMRDPRAIYVSDLRRRRIEPSSLPFRLLRRVPPLLAAVLALETTLVWKESVTLLRQNRSRHRERYLVVRFEDLVADPRPQVERICRFIGIPFEEAMLEQVVVSYGQSVGDAGFDAAAAERWRSQIGPVASAWFRLWLGRDIDAFGYRR
jgi:hypothetical protein